MPAPTVVRACPALRPLATLGTPLLVVEFARVQLTLSRETARLDLAPESRRKRQLKKGVEDDAIDRQPGSFYRLQECPRLKLSS